MTQPTISELLFEELCATRAVPCRAIPVGASPTPDYEVVLGVQSVIVEIKQLDANEDDRRRNQALESGAQIDCAVSPAGRLRDQIARGYRQLRSAARDGQPCLLVIYNNSGFLNFIDSFTVTTAMFGSYGVRLGLTKSGEVHEMGRGFMGNRRVTRNTCKRLSALGVLKDARSGKLRLEAYHNPFAEVPIAPSLMVVLAESQFIHRNPHDGRFVSWEPSAVGA
jgi:hypothetical protein